MKVFKLFLAALVMTFIATASNAQGWIEEEDLQIFGNTRALTANNDVVKFAKTTKVTTQEITITNTLAVELEIVGFVSPAGVTVLPKSKTISPNSSSTLTVSLYPEIAGDSVENEVIVVKTKPTSGANSGKVGEKSFKIRFE